MHECWSYPYSTFHKVVLGHLCHLWHKGRPPGGGDGGGQVIPALKRGLSSYQPCNKHFRNKARLRIDAKRFGVSEGRSAFEGASL